MKIWNIDDNLSNSYMNACKTFVENDESFKDFRRCQEYRAILEHVSEEQGRWYYNQISENLKSNLSLFSNSETIGNPYTYDFDGFKFSPTTIRYIKVLEDLKNLFGDLTNFNIIEIGGGYGGQCKIICNSFYVLSSLVPYTIIDDFWPSKLQSKFLRNFGIIPYTYSDEYDLVISNYAFDEMTSEGMVYFRDNILNKSKHGYITINNLDAISFLNKRAKDSNLLDVGNGKIYYW